MCIRLAISVEGSTEINFVDQVLAPWLIKKWNVQNKCYDHMVKPYNKGGNVSTKTVVEELKIIIDSDKYNYLTTLYDYYAYKDAHGQNIQNVNIEDLEQEIFNAVVKKLPNSSRFSQRSIFIPYVQMYEFEGLLFSDPDAMSRIIPNKTIKQDAECILKQFNNQPEKINNNQQTSPKQRLKNHPVNYKENVHGHRIAKEIGIPKIKQMCPRFKEWVEKLENL